MSRFLFSLGAIVLLLSALSLSAQVRDEPAPRQKPPPKAVAPDKGLAPPDKAVSPDQPTKRRSRSRCYLGVYTMPVEDLSSRVKKRFKIDGDDGVVVVEVMPDSPADDAGVRHGDVITHVNGKLVEDEDELSDDLNRLGPGKEVKLAVCRDGKKQEITAKLEEAPRHDDFGPPPGGDAGASPGGAPPSASAQERLQRIERLERKISRLEKRLADLERTQSTRKPD
jgi:membrane-associated protease RseP (regulator of RpoE activity)